MKTSQNNRLTKLINGFNGQLGFNRVAGFDLSKLKNRKPFDGVVIAGMGGSGLVGNILQGAASELGLEVPVTVWKSFGLPNTSFRNPLMIFVSFSGETKETISGFKEAVRKKITAAAVSRNPDSSLGRLAESKRASRAYFEPDPETADILTPRQSCGYMFYATLKILKEAFPKLKTRSFQNKVKPPAFRQAGKDLAKHFSKRQALIYSFSPYEALGYIWKVNLNETAKHPAFANSWPEATHNEIMSLDSWLSASRPAVLIIKPAKTSQAAQRKFKAFLKFLNDRKIKPKTVELSGKSFQLNLWQTASLAYWNAFYLAQLNQVDPLDISLVEALKK